MKTIVFNEKGIDRKWSNNPPTGKAFQVTKADVDSGKEFELANNAADLIISTGCAKESLPHVVKKAELDPAKEDKKKAKAQK